jgi:glutamyl endopeptidase
MKSINFTSKYAKLTAAVFGLALLGTTAAIAASDDPVSSNGARIAVKNYAATMGGVNADTGTDRVATRGRSTETASEYARLKSLKAVRGAVGTESIIGADNRFRINPTTSFPARAVVLITFSAGRCTGWMANSNTVITAGHCVHRGNNNGFYPTSSFRVYPGRNGTSSPFGSCTAKSLHTVNGWASSRNEQYDYGAIKLNCGFEVGSFGFWWQSASLTGLFTRVSGYPGDKPLTQWQSTNSVKATTTNQVFYQNDTVGGNSGGPVWQNRGSTSSFCQGACVMAIHAYGLHGIIPHSTNNHGTRITQAKFNNIMAWRALP